MRCRATVNFGRVKRGQTAEFPDDSRTAALISNGVLVPEPGEQFVGPARGESAYTDPVVWSSKPVRTVPVPVLATDDDEDSDEPSDDDPSQD